MKVAYRISLRLDAARANSGDNPLTLFVAASRGQVHLREEESALLDPTLAALGWTDELEAAFTTTPSEASSPLASSRSTAAATTSAAPAAIGSRTPAASSATTSSGAACPRSATGSRSSTRPATAPRSRPCSPAHEVLAQDPWLKAEEHILVANVDMLFLVAGLDQDFNPRRLERYLTAAWDSGADPVVVLTKLDLCDDLRKIDEAEAVAIAFPFSLSATSPATGRRGSRSAAARTHVALLGSSGAGKSTLVNRLAGRTLMPIGDLRRDGRGRHTTRHRQLLVLRDGSILVDTPGLRELQIWEGDVDSAFSDVAELASQCRFNDCASSHGAGCAVREALGTRAHRGAGRAT